MNYMEAWREGHREGMLLVLHLINEFTGQDFQTSSEVILHIKELELNRENAFYKEVPATLSAKERLFIDTLAEETAIQNSMWRD